MPGGANWSNPTLSSLYTNFLTEVKARDEDAITLVGGTTPSNLPTGAIRYNRSTKVFEEWSGAAWVTKTIDVAGLNGLGTMATQNASAVAITGGTIANLGGDLTFLTDVAYNLASNAKKVKNAYIGSALVIPVGTDKWATS